MASRPPLRPDELTGSVSQLITALEHLCAAPDLGRKMAFLSELDSLRAAIHYRQFFDLPKGWKWHGSQG
jgi:nitrate reductase assembly molybdenum cofactor insertion protein NarJ